MKCERCDKELNRDDFVRAVVTGWYHDQYEDIPGFELYEVLRVQHCVCEDPKRYPKRGDLNGD